MGERYTEGVTSRGAVILDDGEPMTTEMVVERLNRLQGERNRAADRLKDVETTLVNLTGEFDDN